MRTGCFVLELGEHILMLALSRLRLNSGKLILRCEKNNCNIVVVLTRCKERKHAKACTDYYVLRNYSLATEAISKASASLLWSALVCSDQK